MDIKIYTTESCGYCKKAKEFFKERGLEYEEYNVGDDIEKRHEMIMKSGQLSVPVITIGKEVIVGFDRDKFNKLFDGRE